MVLRCEGRRSFPVPLGCDILKCLSVSFLGEAGLLEEDVVGYFPSHTWKTSLRSFGPWKNSSRVRLWWNSFLRELALLRIAECFGCLSKWLLSPLPAKSRSGLFPVFTVRTWEDSWGWNSQKWGVRLEHVALEFFSGLSTLSLQQLTNNSFPSPVLVPMVVSAPVSCDPWYLPVCLSSFWGSDLPGDLNFLMDLRKTVDLQISFLVVRTLEWRLPSSLYPRPETKKLKPLNSNLLLILLLLLTL